MELRSRERSARRGELPERHGREHENEEQKPRPHLVAEGRVLDHSHFGGKSRAPGYFISEHDPAVRKPQGRSSSDGQRGLNCRKRNPQPNSNQELSRDGVERTLPFLHTASNRGGVLEAPVNPFQAAGKDGAALRSPIANGDHVVESIEKKIIDRFWILPRQIDSQNASGSGSRHRVDFILGGTTSALHPDPPLRQVAENPF